MVSLGAVNAGPPWADARSLDAAWDAFDRSAGAAQGVRLAGLFETEPERLARMTLDAAGLHLDLSKQSLTAEGLDACLALAEAAGVGSARAAMFAGEAINRSERRAVLHAALRAPDGARFAEMGKPVSGEVESSRATMRRLADSVRNGEARGATGERFTAVINIGIGGSDLGPRLVWEALRPRQPALALRFASNVDGAEIDAALAGLDPATTLVVVASKTFTTLETLSNAQAARAWLAAGVGEAGVRAHLAAVSARPDRARAFGVDPDRVFAFADWVGGRFSLWSAVGLACAVGLGWETFERLLTGAAAMDDHFLQAPFARNAPVLLAMAQVWNRNGLGRGARAVVPYAQRLRLLPAFLQQLEMESNGKRVGPDGRPVRRAAAPVVFGEPGTNGQHAFFQLLHQGIDVIPVEFIAAVKASEGPPEAQAKLLANCVAQAEALLVGRSEAAVRAELAGAGLPEAEIDELAPQRTFPGDRPSTTLLMPVLTPETLGALIALYEHKTFVEGVVWGVNSFDQWGVELGKTLAGRVLAELEGGPAGAHDPSTADLIARIRR